MALDFDTKGAPARNGTGGARKINHVPIYVQVLEDLRNRIDAGEIKGALPAEIDLAREYGCSTGTMRKARETLQEEGRIACLQGRGTYIIEHPSWDELMKGEVGTALAHLGQGRFRLGANPSALALVQVDVDGKPITMKDDNGTEGQVGLTRRDVEIIAGGLSDFLAWLDRGGAMAAAKKEAAA